MTTTLKVSTLVKLTILNKTMAEALFDVDFIEGISEVIFFLNSIFFSSNTNHLITFNRVDPDLNEM